MITRAAIALVLAAEALALYTVGEVVMRIFPERSNELVSAPAFLIVGFVAFLAPAALDWFAVEGGRRASTIGVVGIVLLYGALRLQYANDLALWDFGWVADFVLDTGSVKHAIAPVLTSGFLLLLTWVRAAWRARSGVWLGNAPRSLAVPFALVTIALVITAGSEQAEVVTRGGVIFYGVALAALASSQLSQSGATIGGLRSSSVTTLMLLGTGAFAALGVLLIGVFLDPLLDFLSTPAIALGKAIQWFVFWVIFYPIVFVIGHIFEFIVALFGLGQTPPEPVQPPEAVDGTEQTIAEADGEGLPSRIARWVLAGGALFLGIAIVAAAVFIIAFLRRRAAEAEGALPESERAGSLGDDLRGAARNLFRRDRRHEPAGEGAVRLYQEVLESARRAGAPRADAQTAHEFAPVLISAFHRDVTDEITAAFEYARYAGRPPDESTLSDLRRRWEQRG